MQGTRSWLKICIDSLGKWGLVSWGWGMQDRLHFIKVLRLGLVPDPREVVSEKVKSCCPAQWLTVNL